MYYATSYHFTLLVNGVIKSTETFIFPKDTLGNRLKTKEWFKHFVKFSGTDYEGNCYLDFLSETINTEHKRLTDGNMVIDVRNHKA